MTATQNPQNGITEEAILQALRTVQEPELHQDLVTLNMVRDITIRGKEVGFTIMLTTPACPLRSRMEQESIEAVKRLVPGVETVNVRFDATVRADSRIAGKLNIDVKNIIAVASGKGGVGKSTVSTNLAVSLALEGAQVGVLDADIYGPNIPIMFGLSGKPRIEQNKMVPLEAYGVKVISMGFLMPEGEAVVWRGPMLHKAIQQLFTDVRWGSLDYLIVDLPPGTGDAQLSLAQSVPLTGGIIVTTPQAVAISDARRGATAFKRLEVPILGVIENMAGEIFGMGGGEEAARQMGVEFLGRIELDPRIREGGDAGKPIVIDAPDSAAAQQFRTLARLVAARISVMTLLPDPELRIL
ncbi:Mrp/NBP35 family ATP-binding protein [Litorilinea aerophila]|uniref:Iron-sulfur cluster carrier protein n=1 Tax=Litorilinea aerophila TaxID=1204385 RepID=A0A540VH77_9CHLR|nr:Mrp/NBP35 family ATP-binding protein [Litorilinea aerophila]MCC9076169.1 Mrp/NBP35 family ATP-binding protein [Litorilinea aerophila]